jgi:hypothetical protein
MYRLADIGEAKIVEIRTVLDAEGNWLKEYTETPLREQRGAIDTLIKTGIPTIKEASTEDVKARLSQTLDIIRKRLSPEAAESLINEIETAWR